MAQDKLTPVFATTSDGYRVLVGPTHPESYTVEEARLFLANLIEQLPKGDDMDAPGGDSWAQWLWSQEKSNCGTAACIAGWAAKLFYTEDLVPREATDERAQRALCLPYEDAQYLFAETRTRTEIVDFLRTADIPKTYEDMP